MLDNQLKFSSEQLLPTESCAAIIFPQKLVLWGKFYQNVKLKKIIIIKHVCPCIFPCINLISFKFQDHGSDILFNRDGHEILCFTGFYRQIFIHLQIKIKLSPDSHDSKTKKKMYRFDQMIRLESNSFKWCVICNYVICNF